MSENEEPKIIVDDDWKSQVEREKEELQKKTNKADDSSSSISGDDEATSEPGATDGPMEFPPASFSVLVSTVATQAMASLGILPDPVSGKANSNKPMAKHFIDTLGVLEEKTKGNLDQEEAAMLRDALHQLRMVFVSMKDEPAAPETDSSDAEPKSTIELP